MVGKKLQKKIGKKNETKILHRTSNHVRNKLYTVMRPQKHLKPNVSRQTACVLYTKKNVIILLLHMPRKQANAPIGTVLWTIRTNQERQKSIDTTKATAQKNKSCWNLHKKEHRRCLRSTKIATKVNNMPYGQRGEPGDRCQNRHGGIRRKKTNAARTKNGKVMSVA